MKKKISKLVVVFLLCLLFASIFSVTVSASHPTWDSDTGTVLTWKQLRDFGYAVEVYKVGENGAPDQLVRDYGYSMGTRLDIGPAIGQGLLDEKDGKADFYIRTYCAHSKNFGEPYTSSKVTGGHASDVRTFSIRDFVRFTDPNANSETLDHTSASYRKYRCKPFQIEIAAESGASNLKGKVTASYELKDPNGNILMQDSASNAVTFEYTIPVGDNNTYQLLAKLEYVDSYGVKRYERSRLYRLYGTDEEISEVDFYFEFDYENRVKYAVGYSPSYDIEYSAESYTAYTDIDDSVIGAQSGIINGIQWRDSATKQPMAADAVFEAGHSYEAWIRVKPAYAPAAFKSSGSVTAACTNTNMNATATVMGGISGVEDGQGLTIKVAFPTVGACLDTKFDMAAGIQYEKPLVQTPVTLLQLEWILKDGVYYQETIEDVRAAKIYDTYNSDGFKNGIRWYDMTDGRYVPSGSTEIMRNAHEYRLEVVIQSLYGAEFDLDKYNYNVGKHKWEKLEVSSVPGLDSSKYIMLKAEMDEKDIYPRLYLDPPVTGSKPDYAFSGDTNMVNSVSNYEADSPYYKNGIGWYDLTAEKWLVPDKDVFAEGHEYEVYTDIEVKNGLAFTYWNYTVNSELQYGYVSELYINGVEAKLTYWNVETVQTHFKAHAKLGAASAQKTFEQPQNASLSCGGEPVSFTFDVFQDDFTYEWQMDLLGGQWMTLEQVKAMSDDFIVAEGYNTKTLTVKHVDGEGTARLRCVAKTDSARYTSSVAVLNVSHFLKAGESLNENTHSMICTECGLWNAHSHTKIWFVSVPSEIQADGTVQSGLRYFICSDCGYRSSQYVYKETNEDYLVVLKNYYTNGTERVYACDLGEYRLLPTPPARKNARFLGWALTPDAAEPVYGPYEKVLLVDTTALYAVWEDTVDVLFTEDYEPEPGVKMTVDIEAMAEYSEILMEAYLDGDVTYQWITEDGPIAGATDVSYTPTEADRFKYIGVDISDGENTYYSEREMCYTRLKITEQPQNAAAQIGQQARVSFTARGENLTYKWYFRNAGESGFTATTSFKGDSYYVAMTEARAGREVYCEVTDKWGDTVETDSAFLYIGNPATITTQPKSAAAASGEKVTVSLKATGDGLTYAWYFKDKNAESFTKTDSFTGNTYTVAMTNARDGRQLYCVVTDKYGAHVCSETVTIEIKRALTITAQPKSVTVKSGERAEVSVEAVGNGLTYAWYFKDKGMEDFKLTTSFTGNIYTVPMNADRAGRQVYCVVTDLFGQSVQSKIAVLKLDSDLQITAQPKSVTVKEGDTAKVTVAAEGTGLTYKWYYKNKGDADFLYTSSFKGSSYYVAMNAARDGRQVYCVITDASGNSVQSAAATLSMEKYAAITTQPKTTYTKLNATAKTTVKASGDGLTYQWYIKNAGKTSYSKSSVTTSTYSCKMTYTSKDRIVYCVVTDKYGNSVQSEKVRLRMAATITTQPKNVTAAKGEKATATVIAAGDGLTYKWYYKDKNASGFTLTTSFTGTTYSVEMTSARDGRQIYCVVTDKYGKTHKSNTVTLSMK